MEVIRIVYSLITQAMSIGVFATIQDAIYHNNMLPNTLLPIFALCRGTVRGNNKRKSLVVLIYLNVKALFFQLLHYILAIVSRRLEYYIVQNEKSVAAPPMRKHVLVEQRRERNRKASIMDQLSLEIWHNILSNVCPSQLTKVAQVSKKFADIVTALPLWQRISMTAKLGEIKARGRRKTYYGLVLASSHRICERCYKVCKKNTPYQAALPLHLPEQNKTVRLCLDCRRDHLMKYPESQDRYLAERYGGQVGLDAVEKRRKAIIEKKEMRKMMELGARGSGLCSEKGSRNVRAVREPRFQRS